MDDHTRTRKTLDDLAELYLTGLTSPDQSPGPQASQPLLNVSARQAYPRHDEPEKVTVRQPPGNGPKLTITHPFITEAETDVPPPGAGHTVSQKGHDPKSPDYALALASIAQSQQDTDPLRTRQSEADIPASGSKTLVEAVFLGNLPGFSGPWLTQYAHYQAKRHGVIVVLSIDGDGVDVELVAPPGQSLDGIVERYTKSTRQSDWLAEALQFLANGNEVDVGGWLVHLSTPIGHSVLQRAQQMDQWTLLCGADDAAVVSAYQVLKQLNSQPAPSNSDQPDAQTDRHIGVMVMGSDDSSGRVAAMKLNHTAGSFLGTPVELVGCQKQMQPVNAQPLGYFTGGADEDLWSLIQAFLEMVETGPLEQPADNPPWEVPHVDQPDEPTQQPVGSMPCEIPHEDQPDEPVLQEEHEKLEESEPLDEVCTEPPTAINDELNLSTLMPDGFIPLEARCPLDPEVHLVLDSDGQVHVLMHAQGNSASQVDEALGATVSDLLAIGMWVRQHLALLKLTSPNDHFDEQADPVLHLFTDQPKAATALVGRLELTVKVHLLQQVHVGSLSTWHCCELN